jgi:hypothetical protein
MKNIEYLTNAVPANYLIGRCKHGIIMANLCEDKGRIGFRITCEWNGLVVWQKDKSFKNTQACIEYLKQEKEKQDAIEQKAKELQI